MMRELHERASAEIEKQEKLRKRRMAIAEASKSNANADQNTAAINEDSAGQLNDLPQTEDQPETHHNTQGAENMKTPQNEDQKTAQSHQNKNWSQTKNMVVNSAAPALPNVVLDDFVYRLVDLVNADFKMPESDKDFELSHA